MRGHLDATDWSKYSPSRRRILETFLKLAIEHGVNSVTMRMIAAELGIKAPSIYSHFPNGRDELVAESLLWHFNRFESMVLDAVDSARDASEFWNAMVRLHFVEQLELPESNLWDLLIATDRVAHVLPDALRDEVSRWNRLYEAMYCAAAEEMGYTDPAERVRLVLTLLEGAGRWYLGGTDSAAIEKASQRVVLLSRSLLAMGA